MLTIKRLRIEIQTEKGLYGLDEGFSERLNLLASDDNTCGKSSVLVAIYYCLGFEQIIGGIGEKVLTSAYKTFIEADGEKLSVLESKIYLEITNGMESVTIFRPAKMQGRDTKLVTVYYSKMEALSDPDVLVEDMYVHMPNSATNVKGFHRYLEKFLHMDLPMVPTLEGAQRKLYLQLIFSCMFIEQKHGWGDIFSGIPFLGIKDSKKRVLEYVLGLDTLGNEKRKEKLRSDENHIKNEWMQHLKEIYNAANKENCNMVGLPMNPCILTKIDLSGIHVFKGDTEISEEIKDLQMEYNAIPTATPKIIDNFDELQNELEATENDIEDLETNASWLRQQITQVNLSIRVLDNNIEILENDLRNNKDSARLRDLGSELRCKISEGICPTCEQPINDSLLPNVEDISFMSIDENIRHLEAQKSMLNYAKVSQIKNKHNMDNKLQAIQSKVVTLRRLAKALRSDLYSVDDNLSETIVYKKIDLESKIENLQKLKNLLDNKKEKLLELSEKWKKYLEEKETIPKKKFSDSDVAKIKLLRKKFVHNLEKYGYKSIVSLNDINISEETYLPVVEEFDMKFDSSASDNVRAIWAYTIALMQVSAEKQGNHPNIVIFDEPKQHSVVQNDMDMFFQSIIDLNFEYQAIVGITIKDPDAKESIKKLTEGSYKLVQVSNKAFQRL